MYLSAGVLSAPSLVGWRVHRYLEMSFARRVYASPDSLLRVWQLVRPRGDTSHHQTRTLNMNVIPNEGWLVNPSAIIPALTPLVAFLMYGSLGNFPFRLL